MRKVLIIDGQGGGIGSKMVKSLAPLLPPDCELICVGTNSIATNAMLKAGAARAATGENAVIYNAGRADVILGPIGIIMANAILGEVTPKMAAAVSGSEAKKLLIPSQSCNVYITGVGEQRLEEHIHDAVNHAMELLSC